MKPTGDKEAIQQLAEYLQSAYGAFSKPFEALPLATRRMWEIRAESLKGESMILLTPECKVLWCWRQVAGEGTYCSVFRNEGGVAYFQVTW